MALDEYLPPFEKPWRKDPTIMTDEPKTIHQRLPKRSLTKGIKGRAQIAPSEYAAAIIPSNEPWGFPKSG